MDISEDLDWWLETFDHDRLLHQDVLALIDQFANLFALLTEV
jgi:hypothetical protein